MRTMLLDKSKRYTNAATEQDSRHFYIAFSIAILLVIAKFIENIVP